MSEKFFFNPDRGSLEEMCVFLKENGVERMIEIGSLAGVSTEIFSKYFEVLSVDPYIPGYDSDDINSKAPRLKSAEVIFEEKFRDKKNVKQLKKTSEEASLLIDDNSYDFVYIDANHRYEPVKKDINLYVSKIKNTGFIGGHDYDMIGVKKAVDEKFENVKVFNPNHWVCKL